LAGAMAMMRGTNPNNVNLAYMIEDYVTRMVNPDYKHVSDAYYRTIAGDSGEDRLQLAERLTEEADRIFRYNYPEGSSASIANECRWGFILRAQGRAAAAIPHDNACREATQKGVIASADSVYLQ
jgi:hypothetical protein